MTGIYTTLASLINGLDDPALQRAGVIPWASPVPAFGNLAHARVATLGLNPSNREFVDESGNELDGSQRRFHTLDSLGISRWADADNRHLRLIVESCEQYFSGNPYDRWFKVLDRVVAATNTSYYWSPTSGACHLDLVPYATASKWTDLSQEQRKLLLHTSGDALALLLRDSYVRVLILNGQTVVNHFREAFGATLDGVSMTGWNLPRASAKPVPGVAYQGIVETLRGVDLGRPVVVLGFNHNLQSSYGVTSKVIERINEWIGEIVDRADAYEPAR
jgi:hypothetical protein